ncbi:tRNA-specific adenosine deaminase [Thermaurantimonas aggregans]|uniref:tRNA-specific adenosine deaminase n=1 Tax=Thermaurantimonas aggregans TaxID=2173829 RepID=A0A401XMR2_9FLAO|nr:nucleoside deaminase [Thermaurantimonas aggregans]GCD78309.1 tRNA-specific adenosine deaminase [Thermaurantimonas aggregans]
MIGHEYFMRLALKEAEAAFKKGEIPVGAVIVSEEVIIAKGHNQTEALDDVTAHAEMIAITSAANAIGSKYLRNCTLYVTLEPCVMCAGALYWAQIGRVVYGATDEKRGFTRVGNLLHPKTELIGGILQEEAESLLREFFRKLR